MRTRIVEIPSRWGTNMETAHRPAVILIRSVIEKCWLWQLHQTPTWLLLHHRSRKLPNRPRRRRQRFRILRIRISRHLRRTMKRTWKRQRWTFELHISFDKIYLIIWFSSSTMLMNFFNFFRTLFVCGLIRNWVPGTNPSRSPYFNVEFYI